MASDVSDLDEDTENLQTKELRDVNKGMKTVFLNNTARRAVREESPETLRRKAIERAEAARDVKVTLPKLKFLEGEE